MARPKSDYIVLRCTPALKDRVQEEAERRGVSMSEFITDLIKAELVKTDLLREGNTQVRHNEG